MAQDESKEQRQQDRATGDDRLPLWFRDDSVLAWAAQERVAVAHLLNGSRQDVYSSLALYQVPVRYVTTLMVSILTAVGLMFTFAKTALPPGILPRLETGTILLLLLAAAVGVVSVRVLTRYYNVYVSALLFAAQAHYAAGVRSHHWLERAVSFLRTQGTSVCPETFVKRRTWYWKDSHFWYVGFILLLSVVCLGGAGGIWVFQPLSGS